MDFLLYALIGAGAQLVDGMMGMGFGVITNSFLIGIGLPPAIASAGVHVAKIPTTALSGASHAFFGNVDRRLLWRLALPGIVGGIVGALALIAISGEDIKPFVAIYLLLMGLLILGRALLKPTGEAKLPKRLLPLGLAGGFFDAIGGGGWGPIVTSSLVARGTLPRLAVGSVNLAEFFVTIGTATVFVIGIGVQHWDVLLGLTLGGAAAAPFAAYLARHVPAKPMMLAVGFGIAAISLHTLYRALS